MPRGVEELTCLQTLSDFVYLEEGDMRGSYADVCELKSLINLRGTLAIRNLRGSLASAKCERKRSYILVELKLITQLDLSWNYGRYEEELKEEEEAELHLFESPKPHPYWDRLIIEEYQGSKFPSWNYGLHEEELKEEEEEPELLLLESLKPHPNLESLTIYRYPGKKFPSWMDSGNIGVSLPNIVFIKLEFCWRLRHLPALGLLPSLQKLSLEDNEGVEYLIDSRSSLEEEALFPSLKELHLTRMYQLRRVVEPTGSTTNKKRYFPVLEKLVIRECPLFLADGSNEDGNLFATHLELSISGLEFRGVDSTDIKTLPSGLQYLPHLQILTISDCHNIVSLPDWMGNLTSLQELHLDGLDSLASIPDCLQSLTSLQRLLIENCTKLVRRCKKETGVDWHKIAHIPDITVEDEFYQSDSESGEESKHQNEEHELLDLLEGLVI